MNISQLFSIQVDSSTGIVLMIIAEVLSVAFFMTRRKAAKNQSAE